MQRAGVRVLKNAGILAAIEVISKVLGLIVLIMAARRLGVANYGIIAFAYTIAEFLNIFVVFGLNTLIVREVARDLSRTSGTMGNAIIVQSILALLGFLLLVILMPIIEPTGAKHQVTYVAGLSLLIYAFIATFNAFFRAHQAMEYEALVRLSFSLLRTTLLVGVLLLGYGVLVFVTGDLVAYLGALVVSVSLLRRKIARPTFTFQPQIWFHMLRKALPFLLMVGMVSLYVGIDIAILSYLKGDEITGLYGAATKLFYLFAFLPASIAGAILPVMSKQWTNDDGNKAMLKMYRQTFRLMMVVALPLTLGMGMLSKPIINLLYGEQFLGAVPALQIIMIALALGFLNWASSTTLISMDKERSLLIIVTIGAIFNIVSNLIVIPILGHIGASITTVLSEGLILLVTLYVLRQTLGQLPSKLGLGKFILSGLAMALFLWLFRDLHVVFLILPAAVIYLGGLIILRAFSVDELKIIQAFLPARLQRLFIIRRLIGEPSSSQ